MVYCPTRMAIENHHCSLSSQLFALSTELTACIGSDHQTFDNILEQCRWIRVDLTESWQQLKEHRCGHGC
jgi:hypothetical protein